MASTHDNSNGYAADMDLARRCTEGDEAAWAELFDAYAPVLLGRITAFLRTRGLPFPQTNEAEEVLSRVFTGLVARDCAVLRSYRGESGLGTWLSVVSIRTAQNYLRSEAREKARRSRVAELEPASAGYEHPDLRGIEKREAREIIEQAAQDLSPRDRLIIRLHFMENLPAEEISRRLNVSPNSVSPLVHRASGRLREIVENSNREI